MAEPRDLCTIEDVREYLGLKAGQTENDPLLADLIADVSELVYDAAGGREFVSHDATFTGNPPVLTVPSTTRTFYVERPVGELRVGDLAELDGVDVGTVAPFTALDVATVIALPSPRAPGDPIRRLRFPGSYAPGMILSVTGKWGFPSIPRPIRRAAIAEVCLWFERDVRQFSETFNLDENRVERPRALSAKVWDIAFSYRPRGPILT